MARQSDSETTQRYDVYTLTNNEYSSNEHQSFTVSKETIYICNNNNNRQKQMEHVNDLQFIFLF